MNKRQKKMLARIIASAAALVAVSLIPGGRVIKFFLYMLPYLIIGYDILLKAGRGILNRRVFDENFLMAAATVGAMALGLLQSGEYAEAVAVMLFYQIGELFQSYAVGKSRKNIGELMDIRPDYANIERDGALIRLDPDEVEIGSVITVNPGEKIPIDGVIISGSTSLNTSSLTGESLPREVAEGDEVISGCINMSGVLKIRTTKKFGESTASKILDLVENASSRKSKSEAFISRFARVYTPAVCYSALALALIPPAASLLLSRPANWGAWSYRALSFLVASCPCALVVSIPLSFFAGIGRASRQGILVKGSNYLEALSKTECVVFDKTGTLTKGVFEVNGVHHNSLSEAKLLELAALAESASSHPIAESLKSAYGGELDTRRVSDIKEISGRGVTALIDGVSVALGNSKLMESLGIEYKPCRKAGSTVHIAVSGRYEGHILISDAVKEGSPQAISALKSSGVKRLVMLTGDSESAAQQVAGELGIEEYFSELLPADKVLKVEQLSAQKPKGARLAFVGDGINDAPVLAGADIGIAMGAMGSDAAIEAADVVLMDDNPLKIARAIKISRSCMRKVYQNIVFAITVKLLALVLVAAGLAGMWLAVFADVGVAVIAILNAIV